MTDQHFQGATHAPMFLFTPPITPPRPIRKASSLSRTDVVVGGELTYCRATCHCRRCDFRVAFPSKSIPIPTYFCNCGSCRHNTGQMAFVTARIVGEPLDEFDEPYRTDALDLYRPKERAGVERYFCPTCSANMLVRIDLSKEMEEKAAKSNEPTDCALGRNRPEELTEGGRARGWEWRVAGGALRVSDGIIEPKYHLNLASTMDGGFADHMRRYGDVELPRYSEGPGSAVLPLPWRSSLLPQEQPAELSAHCHCKSIEFGLSRPGEAAKHPRAPFPDLLYPADVTLRAKQRNPQDVKWWLNAPHSPGGATRYLAGHCACEFCRSTSASDIQSWGFIALTHLREPHHRPGEESAELFREHLRPKGLKQYVSSPGRYREFCGMCGATVFWWHVGRPEVVDMSIGLLDAGADGVRAEHWFLWHKDRVSFIEASPHQTMAKSLQAGMRESIERRG